MPTGYNGQHRADSSHRFLVEQDASGREIVEHAGLTGLIFINKKHKKIIDVAAARPCRAAIQTIAVGCPAAVWASNL
jgi:hypothetical protein